MTNNNLPGGFKEVDEKWENDRELDWDDEIQHDGPEFVLLPEGDYDFEVVTFERGRHGGSEKLPPCKKAVVHIKVTGAEGSTTIKHNLFLHTITEGMLCAFFAGIGQRQKGEKLKMNWNAVIGARGRLKLGIRLWKNDKGEEVKFNEIKKFYEAAPAQQTSFQAGTF